MIGRENIVFLDFDSTLTTSSTLPIIASIATYPETHPQLSRLSDAYSNDLKDFDRRYVPNEDIRYCIDDEARYLDRLYEVEQRSINRLQELGIFSGLVGDNGREHIEGVALQAVKGGNIALRAGWQDVLAQVLNTSSVVIISVAWSMTFIRACLKAASSKAYAELLKIDDIAIYANEIVLDGSGRLRGLWPVDEERCILTASDKLSIMRLCLDNQVQRNSLRPIKQSVYAGDSTTDLLCLVHATLGICMRDEEPTTEQRQLAGTLQRLKVMTHSLTQEGVLNASAVFMMKDNFYPLTRILAKVASTDY